jgi:hypothetical protein
VVVWEGPPSAEVAERLVDSVRVIYGSIILSSDKVGRAQLCCNK